MPESIEKLRPDRDLQCYFYDESAIAAFSEASPEAFNVSGTWRQQFDWCVVEWNRDNVFEHPAIRTLPDGDLSGLVLTYDETRENCIALDSDLSPTVDWPYLRVWAGDNGAEQIYFVPLKDHATPIEGSYSSAYADFTLSGTAASAGMAGLSYTGANTPPVNFALATHEGDSAEAVAGAIRSGINAYEFSLTKANGIGTTVRAYYTKGASLEDATTGINGSRFGMFAYASGGLSWDAAGHTFAHGTSPTKWRINLDFSNLMGLVKNAAGAFESDLVKIPTGQVRKLRWTYSADQQPSDFVRSEFKVGISNWTVTGTGRTYSVAGPGSWRIEDNDSRVAYGGDWQVDRGNYSGGTAHYTVNDGDSLAVTYVASSEHTLYVGTRYLDNAQSRHLKWMVTLRGRSTSESL
jgi:hypothetical protein